MNYGMRFVTLYRRQESRPSPWQRKNNFRKMLFQIFSCVYRGDELWMEVHDIVQETGIKTIPKKKKSKKSKMAI